MGFLWQSRSGEAKDGRMEWSGKKKHFSEVEKTCLAQGGAVVIEVSSYIHIYHIFIYIQYILGISRNMFFIYIYIQRPEK